MKCVAVILLMKIEALSNGLFEIRGRQTWCLIFLGFLFLVVFTAFLPKTLWKNCIFQYKFLKFILRSTILPSFTISNLLLLNWRSFQYNPIFGEKIVFIDVFIRLLSKSLRKNCFFLIQISKVHVRIYCIANFHDLKLSVTKMTAVSI